MTVTEIKADLYQSIEQLDEKFLKAVYAMVKTYTAKEEIIGYHLNGMPITQNELEEQIQIGEEQIQEERYVSTEELKAKRDLWRSTKS
ncbi:MAG: hypothetical protein AAFO82_00750 [Bacteroidota bacterium]